MKRAQHVGGLVGVVFSIVPPRGFRSQSFEANRQSGGTIGVNHALYCHGFSFLQCHMFVCG